MDVGPRDVAAVAVKAITYAATLALTGRVLFLAYSERLISAQHDPANRRWLGLCALIALAASLVRISVLSGSMTEGAAEMLDQAMISMVLQAG